MVAPKRYAHVLTPDSCERGLIWKKALCRPSWIICVALDPVTSVLVRDTEGNRHIERDGSDAATGQGHLEPQKLEKAAGPSLEPPEGVWPCVSLISEF